MVSEILLLASIPAETFDRFKRMSRQDASVFLSLERPFSVIFKSKTTSLVFSHMPQVQTAVGIFLEQKANFRNNLIQIVIVRDQTTQQTYNESNG